MTAIQLFETILKGEADENQSDGMKTEKALLLAAATFAAGTGVGVYAGRAYHPNLYLNEQLEAQKAGNHWAEYRLWEAYYHGTHGVHKNRSNANKWLDQFLKNLYVVRFEAANGFNPNNASDYLRNIEKHTPAVRSDNRQIGVAGFFRTTRVDDKLLASFLSNEPEKLQALIEANPDLKFDSVEPITPQSFIEYEHSLQESF